MQSKSLFESKTFWVAFLQGAIAVLMVFNSAYPGAGLLLGIKSVLDIILRVATETTIRI